MRSARSQASRLAAGASGALLVLVVAACDHESAYWSPTAPPSPEPAPAPTLDAIYLGEGIRGVDTATAACNLDWTPPDRLERWYWRLVVQADAIEASVTTYDGFNEIRYAGTLTGRDFIAKWESSFSPLRTCEFAESWVSGTLAEDLGSFVAYQSLFYGPREDREMTDWRWTARRE
jgi:hypothetical protein